MRLLVHVLAAVWLTAAATHAAQTNGTSQPLAGGTWRSTPMELPLTTEFHESVWGKNATSVRTVDLTVRPGGQATLIVRRRVVDARGRTVKASESIEQADLLLGGDAAAPPGPFGRIDLPVTVTAAERQYPDDPALRWPIDGLRVSLTRLLDDPSTLEVRVDTPDGRDSFWDTLRRVGAARSRNSSTPKTP